MPPPLDVFPLAAAPQGAWGRRYVRGGKTASGGLRDYNGFRVFEKPRGTRVFGDLRPKPRRDFEMQARFYLPMWGRFASPDPARDQHFEETQSWNIYSYVRNNPVMNTDPTGMLTFKEAWEKTKQFLHISNPSTTAKPSGGVEVTPGRKIWISPTPDGGKDKGKLVDDGKGTHKGQCVSLAKNETGIPSTSTWHAGAAVQGNNDIKPGTVIAAMKDGKDWKSGGHVGLYVGQDPKTGLRMTDQFVTGGDHPVATRTYAWAGHGDHPSVQSQGSQYHVVETGK